jgi:hypothetical protein
MLLAGWLFHSIRLAAALGLALMTMQAPAVTREYQAALLQLVRQLRPGNRAAQSLGTAVLQHCAG